jgi:hypothetical protein
MKMEKIALLFYYNMAVTLSAEETLNFRRKLPKVFYKPYRKRLYQVHLSTDGNQTYN